MRNFQQNKLARSATRLVRTFVLTGEPRNPVIATWSLASVPVAPSDEPESLWPAAWSLLLRRAFHPRVMLFA